MTGLAYYSNPGTVMLAGSRSSSAPSSSWSAGASGGWYEGSGDEQPQLPRDDGTHMLRLRA